MDNNQNIKPYLLGRLLEDLKADADRAGHRGFRAKQLFGWIYRNKVRDLDEPSNLAADFREWVREHYKWGGVEILKVRTSNDGSRKFAFSLDDGKIVEGILMPDKSRRTLCISSQVGCAVNCGFCMTAKMGLVRNLRADEIVDQVRVVSHLINDPEEDITNIVFMGMGEPLHNFKQLLPALQLLVASNAFKISGKKITVSTAGYVPGIDKLGQADTGVNLAISLNATEDSTRTKIMPLNKRWPIADLLDACRRFPLHNRRRITFEYVMLKGVNDTNADAKRLRKLLHDIPHKINLIPWNPDSSLPFERSDLDRIDEFQQILLDFNESVFVRWSKGLDIDGACGQLVDKLAS